MSARSSASREADAFRSLGLDRRDALWAVRALDGKSAAERLPLFDQPAARACANWSRRRKLPPMPLGEHVIHDYRSLGLSLKAHPVAFLRERLDRAGVTPNARPALGRDGRRVSVAGLVLVRQRPGKGNAIFLTLEDEKARRQRHRLAADVRALPADRHGRAASSGSAASCSRNSASSTSSPTGSRT